jgi:hypothetical protein
MSKKSKQTEVWRDPTIVYYAAWRPGKPVDWIILRVCYSQPELDAAIAETKSYDYSSPEFSTSVSWSKKSEILAEGKDSWRRKRLSKHPSFPHSANYLARQDASHSV